jgi:general secretion pathway protein D
VSYRDIEIADFLKLMAQIAKKNVLVDETIKGKITILSHSPIPVNRALDFMKQVLELRGLTVLEEPNLVKVVPMDVASSASIPDPNRPTDQDTTLTSQILRVPSSVNINDLANVLKSLAGKNTVVAPYKAANTIIIKGYAPNVRRVLSLANELIPRLDVPGGTNVETDTVHIYRVKNMPAESLAQTLTRLDNPQAAATPAQPANPAQPGQPPVPVPVPVSVPETPGKPAGKIRAVSHKESNSIIVTASDAEWREIEQIIRQLDMFRQQILLEVLIAEVSSTDLNDFGIDWRYQGTNSGHSQFNTGLAAEGKLVDPDTGKITGNNTLSGFSLGFLKKGGELLGIFNANMNNQNFNVLSAPQVLTLDNQEAEINVGQDVPVRTQERTSGGGSSEATVNSFEYRPSGIKLKFTPHVNAEGMISIDLFSEVTNIEGASRSAGNPTFNKRNVKTYITVGNKQTIVIGGLVGSEKQEAVSKVPLLGDIPVLGFLFRRTTISDKRTNLMVFITPHILAEKAEADRLTDFKREEQSRAYRQRHNNIRLWPQKEVPLGRDDDLDKIEAE